MKLKIDTTDNLKTIITIQKPHILEYQSPRNQDVWGAILQALKDESVSIDQITSVEVNTGPGSFTGIRVGISIAQAISYALHVPINQSKAGSSIVPNYGKPPSITSK